MAAAGAAAAGEPEAAAKLRQLSSAACFGGHVRVYEHDSTSTGTPMRVSVFVPPQAAEGTVPVLYFLSGLTCTHENFITKAGAQRAAAMNGVMLVCPDTSPRGANVPGEADSWDFGLAAGFYVDATEEKWASHYRMFTYITEELPALINAELPADSSAVGVFGHSMGGHGALICALRKPGMFRTVSAFAPICHPSECPWGTKAFTGYLGPDPAAWAQYDATELMKKYSGPKLHILIDQGSADKFLHDGQLRYQDFAAVSAGTKHDVTIRVQEGYDHSYYFISTFVEDHINFHCSHL